MEDKSHAIITVAGVFTAVSWLVMALRLWVRLTMRSFGLDDAFAILSLLVFSGFSAFIIYGAVYGIGKHTKDLASFEAAIKAYRSFFIADLLYIAASGLVKISFAISLLRVMVLRRVYIYIIYVVTAATTAFSIFYWFFTLFTCSPIPFFWEQIMNPFSGGTCQQYPKVIGASYAHGAVICVGDLTLAILPALFVRTLNMNHRTKMSIGFLLAFGSIASIATIARLPYIQYVYDHLDFLHTNSELIIWSAVEVGVSIIAISGVTLKPLLVKYNLFFTRNSSRYSKSPRPIYGSASENFSYSIGSGSRRKKIRISAPIPIQHPSPAIARKWPEFAMSNNTRRSSSEDNFWTSKNETPPLPNPDSGAQDDIELLGGQRIHKMVEFSTSSIVEEPPHALIPDHEYEDRRRR
ncbi:hypothetical protein FQN50_008470 [Emmonsiellopsis sp. PD_5]|nr:hypothetical protein FQN50_008470 [Emmonsiellopsis sp. PD_5]